MATVLKEAALCYATCGWQVFPCCPGAGRCGWSDCKGPGKHPLTRAGCKEATTDPAQITEWWSRWPDANIGVAAGPGSGVFVLDLDGPEAVAEIERLGTVHGKLPDTVNARTGKGVHQYYCWNTAKPVKNKAKIGGFPIDCRGDGGYVIAPPSAHASGSMYEWVQAPDQFVVAEAPDWLLDFLTSGCHAPRTAVTTGVARDRPELDLRTTPGVPEGGRHAAATRLIGTHLGRNEEPLQVLSLAYSWADRCSPPMDRGEVLRIVQDFAAKDVAKLDELAVAPARGQNWPELGEEAMYGLAGEIVRAIEPNTEADPAAVLVQLLALFGNEVGRNAYFAVGPARHHANLFVMIVGESSKGKKGTALRDAKDAFGDSIKPRIGSGLSSGEGLIARVGDAVYRTESLRDKDKKVIGEQKVLETPAAEDKRLIVEETEFGSVLQVMKRQGNTVSGLIRNTWDDGNMATMTKIPRRATGAHISIIGHITPQELGMLLTDTDVFNGFANRFLWIGSEGRRVLPFPQPHALDTLRPRLMEIGKLGQKRSELNWDTGAGQLWEQLCRGELNRSFAGRLDTLAGRARPQVIRLSLIYALLDGSHAIREEHLRAGVAVWRYSLDSARIIFGGTTGDETADRLLVAIRERPRMTTELYGILGNHVTKTRIQAALQLLVSNQLVTSEEIKTGGRPGKRWMASV